MTDNTARKDIVDLIVEDHKPLRRLIKILKNSEETSLEERLQAFDEFAELLTVHAVAEELVLYKYMKESEDLRVDAFEGDVEHTLADQMVSDCKNSKDDDDLWSAKAKVLAELVEHHVNEEEQQLFPDLKKFINSEERSKLGSRYLETKEDIQAGEISTDTKTNQNSRAPALNLR